MNPETILAHSALYLNQVQRTTYFEQGYLVLPKFFDDQQLSGMRSSVNKLAELSKDLMSSNNQFDLELGHTANNPKLRRVAYADDVDEAIWNLCADSIITDIAADILGPNVRFRDVFVNYKWAGGGAAVKWHQDIAFYPHTNFWSGGYTSIFAHQHNKNG